jgi:hypothetical protein
MHPELERLIKMAIADGKITDKERAIILQKAEKLGEDKDEIELILDGELASIQTQQDTNQPQQKSSNKVGDIKKCPSCGAPVPALTLKCSECGHDFHSETITNKQIRDYIRELQDKLIEADNSLSSKQRAWYGEGQVINKKVTIINTFTLPNTKEALIQLLIFSYSNYESIQDNALAPNPLKKAWLAKAIQSFNLLKTQGEGDNKIQKVLNEYSFLDSISQNQNKKKAQIDRTLTNTQGSTTKKVLKYGGIGCGSIILLSMLVYLFGVFNMYNSDEFKETLSGSKSENVVDSLLTIGKIDEARTEANKLEDYYKNEALDKIKEYEYKRLLESNEIDNARNKANSISSDYKRKDALDDILEYEINRLIESGNISVANTKVNVINSDYKRKQIKDKILLIEIDNLIEQQQFDNALNKAKQIDNSYTREDAIEKIKNSKN